MIADLSKKKLSIRTTLIFLFNEMLTSTAVAILLCLSVVVAKAFVPGQRTTVDAARIELQSVLMAKKVRRKRKEGDSSGNVGVSIPDTSFDFDDLPEFTLESDPTEAYSKEKSNKAMSPSIDTVPPIVKSQMGSVKPLSSLSDLLNDRSLEAQLNFDEPVDAEPLPSFAEFAKAGGSKGEPIGKKKARQQEAACSSCGCLRSEERRWRIFL